MTVSIAWVAATAIAFAPIAYIVTRVTRRRAPMTFDELVGTIVVVLVLKVLSDRMYIVARLHTANVLLFVAELSIPILLSTLIANAMVRRNATNLAIVSVALPAGWLAVILVSVGGVLLSCNYGANCLW